MAVNSGSNAVLAWGYADGTMDSAWLTDFLTLAETGSFSRAAEQRHLTQPAFSRRIRALEDWIGAPLFDRSIMPVTLTAPGRQFLPEAHRLVSGIAEAQRLVRAAAETTPSGLRLGTTDMLAPAFLHTFLSTAGIDEEAVPLDVSVGSEREGETALLRGECHLLLCHRHDVAPDGGTELKQALIARDLLLPVASPAFSEEFGDARSPADIPLLAYGENTLVGRMLRGTLAKRLTNRHFAPTFVSQSTALLHAMALRGRGMAWLPLSLVREDIAGGRLAVLGETSWREPIDVTLTRRATVGSQLLEMVWTRARSLDGSAFGPLASSHGFE